MGRWASRRAFESSPRGVDQLGIRSTHSGVLERRIGAALLEVSDSGWDIYRQPELIGLAGLDKQRVEAGIKTDQ